MQQYNRTIQKMITYDDVNEENMHKHNLNWLRTLYDPHRLLLIGGSGTGKTNALLGDYSIQIIC